MALAAPAEDLVRIREKLIETRQQDRDLKKQLRKTEGEMKELRRKLVAAVRAQKRGERRMADLRAKLDEARKKEATETEALVRQQEKLSGVLAGMLRLSRIPPEVLMLKPDAPVNNLRAAILLHRVLPFYAGKAQDLSAKLEKLKQARADIQQKRQKLEDARKTHAEQEKELNGLLARRRAWLRDTESQRAGLRKQIKTLTAEAKSVQELMEKVSAPAVKLPKKLKKGPVAFSAPVKGRLVYGFGDPDDVGSDSRGMMLSVKSGKRIVAPADGQVVFAGPFKGYGNVLILRHNDDYHSFLAGFGVVDATVGQIVNAGEPLGRVPLEGGRRQVYFELRYRGTPVDPLRRIPATTLAANRGSS